MDKGKEIILLAEQIRALSQIGITYTKDQYDKDRYNELLEISDRLVGLTTDIDPKEISKQYTLRNEYITPKCEVRSVVFNDNNEILLVQESEDNKWSLPGGWADIGYSPKEIAVKETKEETGITVRPVKLLAVTDPKSFPLPPVPHYTYKMFILCEIVGDIQFNDVFDIKGKGFFAEDKLPPLSRERVVEEQIFKMFEYHRDPSKEVYFD